MTATLTDSARAFLAAQHSAAMTTLRAHGTPHTVRVAVALVDGKLWSSGTQARLRMRHLRRDPRANLFVFDAGWLWLSLECRVRILEGPTVPRQSLRLFEVMQAGMTLAPGHVLWNGQERTIDDFLQIMVEEQRLIYEFEPSRVYGMWELPSQ